jgi:hypothetical protein
MPTQLTTGDLVTAANWNSIPVGEIDYTQATANVGSITGTAVDITSTVSHTFVSGRAYRITLGWGGVTSTVALDRATIRILLDAGQMFNRQVVIRSTGTTDLGGLTVSNRFTCPGDISAAAHTFKGQAFRDAGSGTLTVIGSTVAPIYLLLEDIGLA